MGFFSWKTSDTNESISNRYSKRPTFGIKMLDDKGNFWLEHDYEGYGVFGGKDYYELLAEMNPRKGRGRFYKEKRDKGIDLEFNPRLINLKTPKLVRINCTKEWKDLPRPRTCDSQGFFY